MSIVTRSSQVSLHSSRGTINTMEFQFLGEVQERHSSWKTKISLVVAYTQWVMRSQDFPRVTISSVNPHEHFPCQRLQKGTQLFGKLPCATSVHLLVYGREKSNCSANTHAVVFGPEDRKQARALEQTVQPSSMPNGTRYVCYIPVVSPKASINFHRFWLAFGIMFVIIISLHTGNLLSPMCIGSLWTEATNWVTRQGMAIPCVKVKVYSSLWNMNSIVLQLFSWLCCKVRWQRSKTKSEQCVACQIWETPMQVWFATKAMHGSFHWTFSQHLPAVFTSLMFLLVLLTSWLLASKVWQLSLANSWSYRRNNGNIKKHAS